MCRINVRPAEGGGGFRSDVTLRRAGKPQPVAGKACLRVRVPSHLLIGRERKSNEVNALHYNIHEAVGHPSRVQAQADINTLDFGPRVFRPESDEANGNEVEYASPGDELKIQVLASDTQARGNTA